jgi:hypothetical protein
MKGPPSSSQRMLVLAGKLERCTPFCIPQPQNQGQIRPFKDADDRALGRQSPLVSVGRYRFFYLLRDTF